MKLYHIGKVVKDLEEAKKYYKETFGFEPIGEMVEDNIQKVWVLKMGVGRGEDVTLELLQPMGEHSPVYKFLQKTGGGLHHLSYLVDDIRKAIEDFKEKGALILGDVAPSIAFGSQPSVWLYTGSKELIELIEEV
ncbi:MAG: methylmalonyl-CoA/ethylmalonyl-CoA epimerase [Acidobacteriota bacterium]|nr:methylmalonyl-CoA/ethylmalonyl-CoA epimerase [Acidobacteriota bacterium]